MERCQICKEDVLSYRIKNYTDENGDQKQLITCRRCTKTNLQTTLSYKGITAIFENEKTGDSYAVNNRGEKIDLKHTPYKNVKTDKWHWKHLNIKKGSW